MFLLHKMHRLSLTFENMPERHAELAWRFGEPDQCLEDDVAAPGGKTSRWTLASPLPPEAAVEAHLGWAAECLGPHEAFVGELIALGGRVVLRLDADGLEPGAVWGFNARRLLPMAHAGVLIECRFG